MNTIESVHCHHVVPGLADAFRARYVRPSALMTFLEEAAAEHCRAVGHDIFDLLEKGWGWVLVGGGLRMQTYPLYGEQIVIKTWISRWKGVSGIREYRIYRKDGTFLGEAGGRWAFWDAPKRKPQLVPDFFLESWPQGGDSPYSRLQGPQGILPIPKTSEIQGRCLSQQRFSVRRGEVDMYDHLHNTIYLDWMLESVPEHLYREELPMAMGLEFSGEARRGDVIEFSTWPMKEGWIHDVRRLSDGKRVARGYSEWTQNTLAIGA
ncbi:MAG: thioesterase [Spirochaetales bacterium]|nr:thioesterase [Spirochaetales bacterium]